MRMIMMPNTMLMTSVAPRVKAITIVAKTQTMVTTPNKRSINLFLYESSPKSGKAASSRLISLKQTSSQAVTTMAADPAKLRFQLATAFYKQENAHSKLHYNENIRLVALLKQATIGSVEFAKPEKPGFFDVVGNHRLNAWKALGEMSHEEAEEKFCEELSTYLPEFKTWFEDRLREKAEREERERLERERLEQERLAKEKAEKERLEKERAERERQQREKQLRIQQQEQERLRLEQERLAAQAGLGAVESATRSLNLGDVPTSMARNPSSDLPPSSSATPAGAAAAAAAAKSPSRASIDPTEFRNGLRGSPEHELTVGRGEIVTVRVPKPEGSGCTRLMWQYSTADYDIGFGLDFEKKEADGTMVLQPILPIMRVQASTTVAEGRHESTWEGAWLLKFDNSYSMLRSKTVYYRVLFLNV
eukprot:m.56883 g.56883  ORF g.56883 m.56883 type:complete len:420 (-) comp12067_c0_seq3:184-1443(-)